MKNGLAGVVVTLLLLTGCRDITLEVSAPTEGGSLSSNGAVEQVQTEVELQVFNALGYGIGYGLGFADGISGDGEGTRLNENEFLLGKTVSAWEAALAGPYMQAGLEDCENGRRADARRFGISEDVTGDQLDYYLGGYWLCLIGVELGQVESTFDQGVLGYYAGHTDGLEAAKGVSDDYLQYSRWKTARLWTTFGNSFDFDSKSIIDSSEGWEFLRQLGYGIGYYVGYDEGYNNVVHYGMEPFGRNGDIRDTLDESGVTIQSGATDCRAGMVPGTTSLSNQTSQSVDYLVGYWLCLMGSDFEQYVSVVEGIVTGYTTGHRIGQMDSNAADRGTSFGREFSPETRRDPVTTALTPGLSYVAELLRGVVDTYTFTIAGSSADVTIHTSSDIDTVMDLYLVDGGLIISDDDSGVNFNASIRATLSPAVYRIDVSGYSDSDIGSYEILLLVE